MCPSKRVSTHRCVNTRICRSTSDIGGLPDPERDGYKHVIMLPNCVGKATGGQRDRR